MSKTTEMNEEPETLSGVYEELLSDMNEVLRWAKGETSLVTTVLTRPGTTAPQMVALEPDVAAVFTSAEAVNEALRFVIKLTQENPLTHKTVVAA